MGKSFSTSIAAAVASPVPLGAGDTEPATVSMFVATGRDSALATEVVLVPPADPPVVPGGLAPCSAAVEHAANGIASRMVRRMARRRAGTGRSGVEGERTR